MKKILVSILLIICLAVSAVYAMGFRKGFMDSVPPPQLISPVSETADITGKDYLNFEWIVIGLMDIDYCDFRIYKGYDTYGNDLILKEQVFTPDRDYRVKADIFEDGQVYTWVLKQVSYSGFKSDTVSNSFKVIKKLK
ncbi:MAG: hypothetical protein NT088_03935 [Candidatus Omnitrophica bacterium]|nr:hypothetical protein [Candidatus Omnitrophota bacterium]